MTALVLRGSRAACLAASSSEALARAGRRKPPRALWGEVRRGNFRIRGDRSVATVRGTIWYVEDRCDLTITRVRRGRVAVRDFVRHRTVIVRAGERYVARRRR
jgi:hypothetical protein